MGAIAMRIKGKKGLSVVQRGQAVLRKFGSNVHFWTAGTSWLNGIQAANYLDSAGTTSAGVDNPVGLVLDQLSGQSALGTNVVTGYNNSAGWTVSNGVITANTAGAYSTSPGTPFSTGFAAGDVVKVTLTATVSAGTVSVQLFGSSGQNVCNTSTSGTFTQTATVQAGGAVVGNLQAGGGGFTGSVTAVSVQKVLGIPASQATTANKPTLRRGVTNLLTFSNSLGNWAVNGSVGFTSGALDVSGGTTAQQITCGSVFAGYFRSTAVTAGVPSTSAALMKWVSGGTSLQLTAYGQEGFGGTGGDRVLIFNGSTGAFVSKSTEISSYEIKPLANGYWLVVANFTPTSSATSAVATYGVSAGTVFNHNGAGIFAGTLTAAQILACGGIPLTTSSAASSTAGNWGWGFLAANSQYLGMSGPVINPNADHFLAFAGVPTSTGGAWQSVLGQAAGGASEALPEIGFTNTGAAIYNLQGGGGTAQASGTATLGAPVVVDAAVVSQSVVITTNNVQGGSAPLSGTYTTPTNASIGSLGRSTRADYCNSQIGAVLAIQATVSPADRVALRRMLALFAGPTGVAI